MSKSPSKIFLRNKFLMGNVLRSCLVVYFSVFFLGCTDKSHRDPAATIYTGGNIITFSDIQPSVEAVAVKDGRILAVYDGHLLRCHIVMDADRCPCQSAE